MKKILITLIAFLIAAPWALSTPADPTPYKYTQPDGTVIMLQNHGDEFYHWTTDASGQMVEKGADGFYRPVTISPEAHRALRAKPRSTQMSAWSSYDDPPVTNFGDRKILCILANFSDSTYVLPDPKTHFTNMLNQAGYSYDGAIGSVRDYYLDNSHSQYRPQFDVYGPVTLSESSEYYDNNGAHLAIMEAYEKLAAQIPIDDYDTDGDGTIDMVLFYYPGHNEAEGASTESIWPHQSSGNFGYMGSKRFVRYFCTSELRGADGNNAASIGTTCHEFAHSLGLPDFYDTDYGTNGSADTNNRFFDLMSGGNYNDNGRRPPYLTALERNMLGWQPAPVRISTTDDYTLHDLQVEGTRGYRIDGSMDGEYFILECRNGNKWDTGFNSSATGLVVSHIDQSDRYIPAAGRTAKSLWENTNKINAYGDHPCYRIILSQDDPAYYGNYVFPGRGTVTSYSPVDWDARTARVALSGISFDGTDVTFHAEVDKKEVFGYVKNGAGAPIPGAQVVLTQSAYPFAAAPLVIPGSVVTTTDAYGYYSFELETTATDYQIITARMDGYVPVSINCTAATLFSRKDIMLLVPGDGGPATLQKWDESYSVYSGSSGSAARAVGFTYTADELAAMGAVGASLESITFAARAAKGTELDEVYVIVDFVEGDVRTRALESEVTDAYVAGYDITIDVSAAGIVIPEGKDIYVGYGFTGLTPGSGYPFYIAGPMDVANGGNCVMDDFLSPSATWGTTTFGVQYFNFLVSADLALIAPIDFGTHGISYIKVVGNIPTVVVAAGKSLKNTDWYVDGMLADGAPTSVDALAAGSHTYMAVLTYYDGSTERVYFDVDK